MEMLKSGYADVVRQFNSVLKNTVHFISSRQMRLARLANVRTLAPSHPLDLIEVGKRVQMNLLLSWRSVICARCLESCSFWDWSELMT